MSNLVPFPSVQEFNTMKEMGQMAIKSGFLPAAIKTPEQAVVIMLKGRELGIGPMEAFSKISVIQGKPTIDAELMLSLIYRKVPGAVVNFLKTDDKECEIEAKRPGGKFAKFKFTWDDAVRAKLTNKQNWQTYPTAMVRARCISAMARAIFPDALSGASYTPEELGAETDDEGNVISQPADNQAERDITPPAETKPERIGTYSAGDARIYFGSRDKGYRELTIAEAVHRDGLAKVQEYIHYWTKRHDDEGKSMPESLAKFRDSLATYAHELSQKKDEHPLADAELSDDDWERVERLSDEMKGGAVYTQQDAMNDRVRGVR